MRGHGAKALCLAFGNGVRHWLSHLCVLNLIQITFQVFSYLTRARRWLSWPLACGRCLA